MSALSSTLGSVSSLLGVALRRPPGLRGAATIPSIEVGGDRVIDAAWLATYRRLTGDVDDGTLPPCVPQVLAVGLHLEILRDARFPLPALGMVHVDNVIEERSALPTTGTLRLTARCEGHRLHDKGVTFDIVTEAHVHGVDGPAPWRSVMTALVRNKHLAAPQPRREAEAGSASAPRTLLSSSSIRVREDTGRRYAGVAGDANPIHLWATTAKAFGFPRAIAHGMWTLARSLAEVSQSLPARPRRIAVKFVRPVLLPSTIMVDATRTGAGLDLVVRPERAGPPHVVGTVSPLSADNA